MEVLDGYECEKAARTSSDCEDSIPIQNPQNYALYAQVSQPIEWIRLELVL